MFRSAANPIIRLVFAPILLLFYLHHQNVTLPVLAPIFVVIFLTIMPSRPPVSVMLKLLLVLVFVSFFLVFLGGVFSDSAAGFVLFCWGLLFWSFERSHRDPKDLLSTFLLMDVVIMMVMSRQFQVPFDGLPWVMFKDCLMALVVTYASFMIFPGDEKDIQADEATTSETNVDVGIAAFKATAMILVMTVLIAVGSSQSILIAITLGSMIKVPTPHESRIFSRNRFVTTSVGILFTLPILVIYTFGVPMWVVLAVAIFCGLNLSCYAIRHQCPLSIYQLLFTNFVVLTHQIIGHQGASSLNAELIRLISISVAILLGGIILNLLSGPAVKQFSEK